MSYESGIAYSDQLAAGLYLTFVTHLVRLRVVYRLTNNLNLAEILVPRRHGCDVGLHHFF